MQYEIIERVSFTNFKVRERISQKVLKHAVHCSRFKRIELSKESLEHYGDEAKMSWPVSEHEGSVPQNDPPDDQYTSDYPENWDEIFEENPLPNAPKVSENDTDEIEDILEDSMPMTPEQLDPDDDDSFLLFKSLEPSKDTPILEIETPEYSERKSLRAIPENDIKAILEKGIKNGELYYRVEFKKPEGTTRWVRHSLVPTSKIRGYLGK